MKRFSIPLNNVSVAAPCPADWDWMGGSDRVRFCGQCQMNVYNLSAMPKHEAESLISRAEGRLCVRFYRRRDGSIITRDCPVGLRALKRRAEAMKRAVLSSVLGFVAGVGANGLVNRVGVYLLDHYGVPSSSGGVIDSTVPNEEFSVTEGMMVRPERPTRREGPRLRALRR